MRNFNDNDDEFFNENFGDDFFKRWEDFNRMMNDPKFMGRNGLGPSFGRINFDDLFKFMLSENKGRFESLNDRENDFNIPNSEMDIEKGEDGNGKWETKHWSSPDGSMSFTSFTRSSNSEDLNNLDNDEIMERYQQFFEPRRRRPETKEEKINKLQKTLDYLVEQEKYEKAAEVKKMIDELNKPSEE